MKKTLVIMLVLVAISCHDATETLKTPPNSHSEYSNTDPYVSNNKWYVKTN